MNREPHFDENEVLRQCMSPLNEEVPDMPENFHAQWTALVKEDAMKQEETRKVAPMRRWTRILSVAAALVFVVGGTLLTKDSLSPARTSAPQSLADSYDYDYDTYTSDVGYSEEAGSGVRTMMVGAANDAMPETASAKSAVAEDKKIIRNVSLTIKTSAYDDSMASLTALLSQYGGYLESSSEYTNNRDLRTASLTLRIPADSLDAFLSNTGELGRITSRNMSSTDVTASYQDTAARLENQKLLLARLQALTDTAGDFDEYIVKTAAYMASISSEAGELEDVTVAGLPMQRMGLKTADDSGEALDVYCYFARVNGRALMITVTSKNGGVGGAAEADELVAKMDFTK